MLLAETYQEEDCLPLIFITESSFIPKFFYFNVVFKNYPQPTNNETLYVLQSK